MNKCIRWGEVASKTMEKTTCWILMGRVASHEWWIVLLVALLTRHIAIYYLLILNIQSYGICRKRQINIHVYTTNIFHSHFAHKTVICTDWYIRVTRKSSNKNVPICEVRLYLDEICKQISLYLQTRVLRSFRWRFIAVLTCNPIVYMFVCKNAPNTDEKCKNMSICEVFRTVAVMENISRLYPIFFASELFKISIYIKFMFHLAAS